MAAKTKQAAPTKQVPYVGYLRLGARPALVANQCTSCGARFFDRRNACAHCGGRSFKSAAVKNSGRLKSFTIVQRSVNPMAPAPFVSGIVETDDGTSVRANIVGVPADPEHVKLGMKVKLTTFVMGTDDDGTEAIGFGYTAA
jgi:uncharacterized protein